ncbi:SRPBCC domain-containing protein [Thermomonospora cellulosilytica]|uniref:Carbon monoxide dehydrogenase subunit G n=1 Tax=Thermomonospora cellulosilytica TaxID=1411118 RepID=A0A7W3R6C3_9ACTN|nr:SRPBCC domain-containing protein [Thermomonospora cellulosilytica]MBA9001215.1 carbon monoxide dehydrogenase subunit G [Thermomonospora cellulosilytica]
MELDHDFTVPVPVDQAWSVLLDVERVALCMPGATLDSIDGEEYTGRLRVRLGAMTITYRGTARIVEADESARSLTIEARGKEARGSGTAKATIRARMSEEDGATRVTVHTTLSVTGRPAQFGRNILAEVGSRLLSRFAKALAEELAENPPAAASPDGDKATATPSTADASADTSSTETASGDTAATADATTSAPDGDVSSGETDAAADKDASRSSDIDASSDKAPDTEPGTTTNRAASSKETTDSGTTTGTAASGAASSGETPDAAVGGGGSEAAETEREDVAGRVPEVIVEPKDPVGAGLPLGPQVPGPREAVERRTAHAPNGDGGKADPPQQPAEVPAPRPAADDRPRGGAHRRREDDAIDILQVAGPSVAKRAAPALGALAALLAVRYLFRRRRGRHHR